MTAIVYTTNTGSTKRYAEMLGEKTGFPVFDLGNCAGVEKGSEILYLGWVMAGSVQGLEQAREAFGSLKAVCAVGTLPGEKAEADIKEKNKITEPFFFLPGAFDLSKLKGMYKMMMGMMVRMMKAKLKESNDPDSKKILETFEAGMDFVSEDHLKPVLDWIAQ